MSTITVAVVIQPGQMFCSNCSNTVQNTIRDFLTSQQISFGSVHVDHQSNKAQIADVTLKNGQTTQNLYDAISKELLEVGFDCISYEDAPLEMNKTPQLNFLSSSLGYSLLPLGGALMLVEHMRWLPPPSSERGLPANLTIGMIATLLSLYFVQDHVKNAWRRQAAMDVLISIGVVSSLLYSFALIAYPPFFEDEDSSSCFSLSLLILGFLKLSHALRNQIHTYIEAQIDAIDVIKNTLPRVAYIRSGNDIEAETFVEQSVDEIGVNSILRVETNAIVAIDSILLGTQSINVRENFYGKKGLTLKQPGDTIFAGAENASAQAIHLQTTREAVNNHLNQLYASCRAKPANNPYLEWVSQYFVGGVITTAIFSALYWGFFGPAPAATHAVKVFIAVILSACPCGLGLINLNASMIKALALQKNILIQKEDIFSIDQATDVCLDKCGTLTEGEYCLEKLITIEDSRLNETDEDKYLAYTMLLEHAIAKDSTTPIARAIIKAGEDKKQKQRNFPTYELCDFFHNPNNKGRGGTATIDSQQVTLGNRALLQHQNITINARWSSLAAIYSHKNRLPIFLAINSQICCLLILQSATEETQVLRTDVTSVINALMKEGKTIHILTGDNLERTQLIHQELGHDEKIMIQAEQTPQNKLEYILGLKQSTSRKVIMLGDDLNDLGAMHASDYGLAIDAVAPIRAEADAVLNGSFTSLLQLMCLAKTYRQAYAASVLLVFGINGISLLAAAGIFYPIQHAFVDPMITSMGMIASSLLLLINIASFQYVGAMRLKAIEDIALPPLPSSSSSCRYFSCCGKEHSYAELSRGLLSSNDFDL